MAKNKRKKIKPAYKERVWELDFARGVCVILMMLDHFAVACILFSEMWRGYLGEGSLMRFLEFAESVYFSEFKLFTVQPAVIATFFTVAGLSVSFSKKRFNSFFKTASFAAALTLATLLLGFILGDNYFLVTHGVFHMFALCYLFHLAVGLLIKDKYARSGIFIAASVFFFVLYARTESGVIVWGDDLFSSLFNQRSSLHSMDDFYLIPWIGYFLLGAAASPFIYPERESLFPFLNKKWHIPVTFVGRHPIFCYAVDVVVSVLLLIIIGLVAVPIDWLTDILGIV
ncbi:MAG: DUF1624 domain-containing protein [Clostridiales bacterium]|jgi:uncharacterized membrane protein|nr:DUF1624 domain-containing protein [Clostridiales bacterium]